MTGTRHVTGSEELGRQPVEQFGKLRKCDARGGREPQRDLTAEQAANLSQAQHGYEGTGRTLAFRVKDDYLMADTSYRLMKMYMDTVIPQSRLALESSLSVLGAVT